MHIKSSKFQNKSHYMWSNKFFLIFDLFIEKTYKYIKLKSHLVRHLTSHSHEKE